MTIGNAVAQDATAGDAGHGKQLFAQTCAVCHADSAGGGGAVVNKQGPSLVGVYGRHAAAVSTFNYTDALNKSGLSWDAPTLDKFLAGPNQVVPGTTMAVSVINDKDRSDIIAYLATLKSDANVALKPSPNPVVTASTDGDWRHAAPGVQYRITATGLPAPYATQSAGNGPRGAKQQPGVTLAVPPGFTVKLFASGFSNCRLVRVAPNGDIFIAETGANRIHVLRAADGAETPSQNQIYATGLDHPFGIAFYPPGNDPKYIYIANNNSVVRVPYHNGDLAASGPAEVIVPRLCDSRGGHSTRDIAFSPDGKRLFISVGSGSNVAESISKKSVDEAKAWDAVHGLGAAWDNETNRADILVTDPEGHEPLHTFATGIRNGVGIAIEPATGKLWTSTNERDGLGDDLVPDYITSVKEGGFYGWPWYYIGKHEEPRLAGQRPDLADKVIVPDVLVQAHSASLEMCFYMASKGGAAFPADYNGDVFAAFHGSWNRTIRTGYKVIRAHIEHGVPTGGYEDFLTGFVVDDRSVWGRPVGVAEAHDGALLVTDDGSNSLWRISRAAH